MDRMEAGKIHFEHQKILLNCPRSAKKRYECTLCVGTLKRRLNPLLFLRNTNCHQSLPNDTCRVLRFKRFRCEAGDRQVRSHNFTVDFSSSISFVEQGQQVQKDITATKSLLWLNGAVKLSQTTDEGITYKLHFFSDVAVFSLVLLISYYKWFLWITEVASGCIGSVHEQWTQC